MRSSCLSAGLSFLGLVVYTMLMRINFHIPNGVLRAFCFLPPLMVATWISMAVVWEGYHRYVQCVKCVLGIYAHSCVNFLLFWISMAVVWEGYRATGTCSVLFVWQISRNSFCFFGCHVTVVFIVSWSSFHNA